MAESSKKIFSFLFFLTISFISILLLPTPALATGAGTITPSIIDGNTYQAPLNISVSGVVRSGGDGDYYKLCFVYNIANLFDMTKNSYHCSPAVPFGTNTSVMFAPTETEVAQIIVQDCAIQNLTSSNCTQNNQSIKTNRFNVVGTNVTPTPAPEILNTNPMLPTACEQIPNSYANCAKQLVQNGSQPLVQSGSNLQFRPTAFQSSNIPNGSIIHSVTVHMTGNSTQSWFTKVSDRVDDTVDLCGSSGNFLSGLQTCSFTYPREFLLHLSDAQILSGNIPLIFAFLDGSTATKTMQNIYLTVQYSESNQAPTVDANGPYAVNAGSSVTLQGTGNDPDNDPLTYSWDLDNNGSFETTVQNPTFGTSTNDGGAIKSVVLQVCDNNEACTTDSATITINALPQIAEISDASLNMDATFNINGSFSDSDSNSWSATVDYGEGAGAEILVLDGMTFNLNHVYQIPGTHSLTVVIHDNSGAIGSETASITVNAPPQIAAIPNGTISEGSDYSASGSFSDSDSTSWTATVDYGDGSGIQTLSLSDANFALNHQYKDNGIYTVEVTVTDNQGAITSKTATITVQNEAVLISSITSSLNPVQVNASITASATFTDSGVLDTHTAVWNWGDGSTSTGTLQEPNGSTPGSATTTHTYSAAGVYEITLTVTDNDNAQTIKAYQYQSVYDQTAGWASGSKEFTSPQGSVIGNPSATGKANFGFQVKYQQGDVVPSGKNVEFLLPSANLDFTSTGYQWLVVDGIKATLKATGTLNGVSGYTILVSAIDQGQQNGQVRFQIKDPSNNIIYDTQPGAADTANPTTFVTKDKIAVH